MSSLLTDPIGAVVIGARDEEIVALERRLRAAQLDANVSELDVLISDTLLFVGPDGSLATKAEDLAAHASGTVRFEVHEPQELHMRRISSDCALVNLLAQLRVRVSGTPVSGLFRYTRVWVREADGTWRIAGGHVSAA